MQEIKMIDDYLKNYDEALPYYVGFYH